MYRLELVKRFLAASLIVALPVGLIPFGSSAFAGDDQAELAKKLQNPVAALISVPTKLDWDTGIGPDNTDRYTYVVQPVVPLTLNETWNVISRTIVPVHVRLESPVPGRHDIGGMGDILQSFFVSPKAPMARGWIWGAGPALSLPTGDDGLTTDKFSMGPTVVVLKQAAGLTYGGLTNQLWSVSGDRDVPEVSALFLQPFVSFTTKTYTSLGLNTESSYNWKTYDWIVPLNVSVSQLLKVGGQPVSFLAGYRYYLTAPDGGPDWGLRFQVTLLFPKK